MIYTFTVEESHVGKRADIFLVEALSDYTRSQIKKYFDQDKVTIDSNPIKASYLVRFDDEISIDIESAEFKLEPMNLNIEVLYEDDEVAVIYKPAGLVVHPAVSYKEPTLVHGLLYQIHPLSNLNGSLRPGIVHRIDKDTSGLLLVAKTNHAHESLVKQLQDKTVRRVYEAICYKPFEEESGSITTPIGRDEINRLKMAVTETGKTAVTHFKVLDKNTEYNHIECVLETGRTHQIRVHMQYIGHPIVGDPIYGTKPVYGTTGQLLHAKIIGFIHPTTSKYLEFEKEAPIHFIEALKTFNLK